MASIVVNGSLFLVMYCASGFSIDDLMFESKSIMFWRNLDNFTNICGVASGSSVKTMGTNGINGLQSM